MRLFQVGQAQTLLILIQEIIFNWAVMAQVVAHVFRLRQTLSISFRGVASFFPYYYYNQKLVIKYNIYMLIDNCQASIQDSFFPLETSMSNQNDSKYNIMNRQVFYCLCNFIFIAISQTVITNSLPPGCYQSNYTTNFTRCDLTFMFCYSRQVLQQCVMRKCDRYIRGAECYLQTGFILEESKCYESCCGSLEFDEKSCNKYNNDAADSQSKAITGLVIVMMIIAAGLLAIVVWFSIKQLRCCDKSSHFLILKYNIKWKTDKYEQKKCEICRTFGALMVTPCGHHFHISCFEQAATQMVCPKCQQPIADRIKIFCFHCREKSFKVRLYRVVDIAQAIAEGKALHYDLCPNQIKAYRQTIQSAEKL